MTLLGKLALIMARRSEDRFTPFSHELRLVEVVGFRVEGSGFSV